MKKNCVNIQSIPVSLAESFTIVFFSLVKLGMCIVCIDSKRSQLLVCLREKIEFCQFQSSKCALNICRNHLCPVMETGRNVITEPGVQLNCISWTSICRNILYEWRKKKMSQLTKKKETFETFLDIALKKNCVPSHIIFRVWGNNNYGSNYCELSGLLWRCR